MPNKTKMIGRVVLSPITPSDGKLIAKWKNDPIVNKYALSTSKRVSASGQCKDIEAALKDGEQYYLFRPEQTSRAVGYVRASWLDERKTSVWLRYAIGEAEYRGFGYSKAALRLLLARLFKMKVRRVEAEVYEFNLPGIAVLKGLGFRQEGRKRKAHYDNASEKYFDTLVLGLLAEEKISMESYAG